MFTDKGYQAPTQNEIRDGIIQRKKGIDPDFRLDSSTPDGLLTNIEAERDGRIYEHVQSSYDARDPNKATGYDLDVICSLTGKRRDLGSPSTVTLRLSGVAGTMVISGTVFDSGVDTKQWRTNADAVIALNKTVDVAATCLENGANDVLVGQINRIVKSIRGLQSVSNITVASLGTNPQTDESLRIERAQSVAAGGAGISDALYSEILATKDVKHALILQNRTSTVDSDGLPGHSVAPIVHGGTDADVALAIFRKLNIGPQLYSVATAVSVPDVYDRFDYNMMTVDFSRPNYIDMVIAMDIKDDGTLPSGVDDKIFQAILDYATGGLEMIGFNSSGFKIGESVAVNQIMTAVNYVIGTYGNSYIESIDINTKTFGEVVPIAKIEMARFNKQSMSLTLV